MPAQDKFKSKHKLTIALGSDETKKTLAAYGAWGEKSMYGRKFMGVIRKTFLIDAAGRIVRIWPKVRVPGMPKRCCQPPANSNSPVITNEFIAIPYRDYGFLNYIRLISSAAGPRSTRAEAARSVDVALVPFVLPGR